MERITPTSSPFTKSIPSVVITATLVGAGVTAYDGGALSSWESQSIRLPHDSFSGFDTKIHLSDAPPDHQSADVKVSTFTKDELNAKLAQNKAEVDSVAAGMKTEMANFRTAYVESFSEISKTLSRIEAKADATEKRLTQAQWIVSLVISICAVTLSAVIFFSNKSAQRNDSNHNMANQSATTLEQSHQGSNATTPPKSN